MTTTATAPRITLATPACTRFVLCSPCGWSKAAFLPLPDGRVEVDWLELDDLGEDLGGMTCHGASAVMALGEARATWRQLRRKGWQRASDNAM